MSYTIIFDKDAQSYLVETPTEGVKKKLKRTRTDLGYAIMTYIKDRVRRKGMGAYGPLKGYSTKPFRFKKGKKPMWDDEELDGTVIKGGYKEYRDSVGIPSAHFTFSNMGNAWNDWDFKVNADGTIFIGFTDPVNIEAANHAADNGRPDMFDINEAELARVLDGIIDTFEKEMIGE